VEEIARLRVGFSRGDYNFRYGRRGATGLSAADAWDRAAAGDGTDVCPFRAADENADTRQLHKIVMLLPINPTATDMATASYGISQPHRLSFQ
jgi:hypothetical protein